MTGRRCFKPSETAWLSQMRRRRRRSRSPTCSSCTGVSCSSQRTNPLRSSSLDVSQMTREQRDALKRHILAQHPHLVDELTS